MNESRWETSRRSARKNVIAVFIIIVFVSVILGILLVNNRDLIGHVPQGTSVGSNKDDTLQVVPAGSESTMDAPDTGIMQPVDNRFIEISPKVDTSHYTPTTPLPSRSTPPVPTVAARQQPFKQVVPELPVESHLPPSIKLSSILCGVDSRKDVVIYLSLELFFEDAENRSAVLLRREDIKVMVMKTLRTKELGAITTGKLESELRVAINQLFDHSEIVTVKINDIRIEKAVKE